MVKEIKNLQEKRLVIARHIILDQIEPMNEKLATYNIFTRGKKYSGNYISLC